MAPSGVIYAMPQQSPHVLRIDPGPAAAVWRNAAERFLRCCFLDKTRAFIAKTGSV
jgi:hypothetical protein